MKINGEDLSVFGKVKQWRASKAERTLANNTDWVRGSSLPMFASNFASFKDLTVTLMVYGNSRDDISNRISNIEAKLINEITIEFDDWSHKFTGIVTAMTRKEETDTSRHRFQTLELKVHGYEHGDLVSVSGNGVSSITINNPGNAISPAIIELTPAVGKNTFSVSGICFDGISGEELPITLNNITTGNKITLDGITGLFTENKNGTVNLADVEIWERPTLKPGANTITLETSRMNTTVKVLPIYM